MYIPASLNIGKRGDITWMMILIALALIAFVVLVIFFSSQYSRTQEGFTGVQESVTKEGKESIDKALSDLTSEIG